MNIAMEIVDRYNTHNKDGVSLCFFSSSKNRNACFNNYENVSSKEEVSRLFGLPENQPDGSRDLIQVLRDAVVVSESNKSVAALVILDGVPDNSAAVEQCLVELGTNSYLTGVKLDITFLQVGETEQLVLYAQGLCDNLKSMGTNQDVVDFVPYKALGPVNIGTVVRNAMKM